MVKSRDWLYNVMMLAELMLQLIPGLGPGGGLLPPPSSGHVRPVNPPPYQQPSAPRQQQQQQSSSGGDEWGEFASFRYINTITCTAQKSIFLYGTQ